MTFTPLVREAARLAGLALIVFSPAVLQVDAQTPPQRFPDLIAALESTPGCLGVEAGSMASGKQVIFAWFENKQAVLNWYHSDVHQAAMRAFAPSAPGGRAPLAHVADDSGPVLAIASLTPAERPQVDGVQLPVSQIAIELYAPLPGGVAVGGRFAPAALTVPGLREARSPAAPARGAAVPPAAAGSLTVRVTGVSAEETPLRIAVYASEGTWLDESAAAYKTVLTGGGREREWRIERVPAGEYAVAVFHDANRDGMLNRNLLGIPREQYGFSNNARGAFGPASWRESRVAVAGDTTEVAIAVR